MIDVFLYGGILLIVCIFLTFIAYEMNERKNDKAKHKHEQLKESFNKALAEVERRKNGSSRSSK